MMTCWLIKYKFGLASRGTGRLSGLPVSIRVTLTAAVAVVFNCTINCHVLIKYYSQKYERVNELLLNLRDLVSLISRIYNYTFYLRAYVFIYISVAVKFWKGIMFLFTFYVYLCLIFFFSLEIRIKLIEKIGRVTYCPIKPPVIFINIIFED